MFRDILSGSRAIFIGVVFFVVVVGVSLLYSWHVHRTTDAEVAETQRKVQPLKNKNETHTAADITETNAADFEHAGTDLETDETQPMSDDTAEFPIDDLKSEDLTDAFLPDDLVSEEIAEDIPVSPYGFGPYPPLPNDPYWVPETWPARSANHELMLRVSIKLISQGIPVKGGSMQNGLVYPIIKGTRYVEWKEYIGGDGNPVRYISRDTGHPDDRDSMRAFKEATKGRNPTESDFPPSIEFVSYEEGGIDPYTFLDLP